MNRAPAVACLHNHSTLMDTYHDTVMDTYHDTLAMGTAAVKSFDYMYSQLVVMPGLRFLICAIEYTEAEQWNTETIS